MIYLDTNAVVALDQADLRLFTKEARRLIDRDPDLRVSPIIFLELEYLREINRIRRSGETIMTNLSTSAGLRVCDRTFKEVARQAAAETWTRDPFDRIIVAHARIAQATLITRDTNMHARYAKALG